MNEEVTGCRDCPFRDENQYDVLVKDEDGGDDYEERTQYYCKHPKRYLVNLVDLGDGIITPSDCPLYKEPITISIKQ